MGALFVTHAVDDGGMETLEVIKSLQHRCRVLNAGEEAPVGSVAIFTAPESLKSTSLRHRYFRLSAISLPDDLTPAWARATPFRVAVINTEDHRHLSRGCGPNKMGGWVTRSTFRDGVTSMVRAYVTWLSGVSKAVVPWADVDRDPVFAPGKPAREDVLQWLEGVKKVKEQVTVQEAQRLKVAASIAEQLAKLPLTFGEGQGYDKLTGPEALMASPQEVWRLQDQARILKSFWARVAALYRMGTSDNSWRWVVDLIDGSSGMAEREISHLTVLSHPALPRIVRCDQPDFGVSVEIQVPGSGWGFFQAIASVMDGQVPGYSLGPGFAHGFVQVMREIAGRSQVSVVHANNATAYTPERTLFARECTEVSGGQVLVRLSDPWRLALDDKVDIIRRCFLDDLVRFEGFGALFEKYLKGEIEIEPPPCLLFDQKLAVVFPFDPCTRHFFTDEERSLFPPSYLVRPEYVPAIGEGPLNSWLDFADLHGPQRDWVLKYGGADPKRRGGAAEVWLLSHDETSGSEVRGKILRALDDWRQGHPWIIQQRVRKKFPITYLGFDGMLHTALMYARINPVYDLGETPKLFGVVACLRPYWKVHGQPAREGDPNLLLAVHQM